MRLYSDYRNVTQGEFGPLSSFPGVIPGEARPSARAQLISLEPDEAPSDGFGADGITLVPALEVEVGGGLRR